MCERPGFKAKYIHCGPDMNFGDMRGTMRGMMHHIKDCCENIEHWIPHTLDEYENYYLIQVPMPGFSKEDIDISLISDNINIKAKKLGSNEEKGKTVNKGKKQNKPRFFQMGHMLKVWNRDIDFDIPLPPNSNSEEIKPKIANGLLKIKIAKKPPKNINIDAEN